MADCPDMLSDTALEQGATPDVAAAASADGGKSTKPFFVLTATALSDAGMMGGCKCGTAVCTIGRMCHKSTSRCFLPPCPLDGLDAAGAGKKEVPASYPAGCWCAAAGHFGEDTI